MWEVTVFSSGVEIRTFRWFKRRTENEAIDLSIEESLNMGLIKTLENVVVLVEFNDSEYPNSFASKE